MYVSVYTVEKGGEDDGRSDKCGSCPHEVPERLSAGKTENIFLGSTIFCSGVKLFF